MSFTKLELNKLPLLSAIEPIDYDNILQSMLDDLDKKMQQTDNNYSKILPTDPAYKVLEISAYRETLLRDQINQRVKKLFLAYAEGADLDHIGITYYGVARLSDILERGEKRNESDKEYRERLMLVPESWSSAGSKGAYMFRALSGDRVVNKVEVNTLTSQSLQMIYHFKGNNAVRNVKSVGITSPKPGQVKVAVLSRFADGSADINGMNLADSYLLEKYTRLYALAENNSQLLDLIKKTATNTSANTHSTWPHNLWDNELENMAEKYFTLALEQAKPQLSLDFPASINDGHTLQQALIRVEKQKHSGSLLGAVDQALNAEEVRPLTDKVVVCPAKIKSFSVHAILYFKYGLDSSLILPKAEMAVKQYIQTQHGIGYDITRSGLIASLHQEGVQRVELESLAGSDIADSKGDIVCDDTEAAYCDLDEPNYFSIVEGGFNV